MTVGLLLVMRAMVRTTVGQWMESGVVFSRTCQFLVRFFPNAHKPHHTRSLQTHTHTGGPKVYDVTKYLDDHPGGAEVMLDVAGQNADEFFEDIGHSKEAREELKKYCIGDFKVDAAALQAMQEAAAKKKKEEGNTGFMLDLLIGLVAILFGIYQNQIAKK